MKEDIRREIEKEYEETGDVILTREEAIKITIAFFKKTGIEKTLEEICRIVDSAVADIQEVQNGQSDG